MRSGNVNFPLSEIINPKSAFGPSAISMSSICLSVREKNVRDCVGAIRQHIDFGRCSRVFSKKFVVPLVEISPSVQPLHGRCIGRNETAGY